MTEGYCTRLPEAVFVAAPPSRLDGLNTASSRHYSPSAPGLLPRPAPPLLPTTTSSTKTPFLVPKRACSPCRRTRRRGPRTLRDPDNLLASSRPVAARVTVVASVSTQDSNPIAWIANGVGSVTASAWTVLVERSLSIWRPDATTKDAADGQANFDANSADGDDRNARNDGHQRSSPKLARPSMAGDKSSASLSRATQFSDLFYNQELERDDDGLAERLVARRAEQPGMRARGRPGRPPADGRLQRTAAPAHLNPTLPVSKPRSGFFALGRERDDRVSGKLSPGPSSKHRSHSHPTYGGLPQSRIYALMNLALDRSIDGPLDTLLPYDIQRALFTELRAARHRPSGQRSTLKASGSQKLTPRQRSEPTVAIPIEPFPLTRSGLSVDTDLTALESLSSDSGLLLDQVQRAIEDLSPAQLSKQGAKRKKTEAADQVGSPEAANKVSNQSPWGWIFFWNNDHKASSSLQDSGACASPELNSRPPSVLYPPVVEDVAKAIADSRLAQDEGGPAGRGKPPADRNSRAKEQSKNTPASNTDVGGVLNVPLRMVGELLHAVSWVRGQDEEGQSESDTRTNEENITAYAAAMTRDTGSMNETDHGGQGAAVAFAAASAIASRSRSSQLDAIEAAGLHASVTAARAVKTVEDAEVFVDTVGVGALVTAARVLSGRSRSGALTALANIAIILPSSRVDMLTKDSGSLLGSLANTLQHSDRLGSLVSSVVDRDAALCHMESLVSGTHLLGSLALARGRIGSESRRRMAHDVDVVRILQRLAGGSKSGEPEGAARAARRALGAIGVNTWTPRCAGQRGLRILTIDGGGTRAIMAFEMLKYLENITGSRIQDMFDIIGGTSTGAIVAASLGLANKSVDEVEALYRRLIGKIFAKHPVNGPKMLLTRAYYDTRVLEATLKEECGTGVFIDSLAEERMNKVFVVSSIMSRSPQELHIFRNYTYPLGHESRYDGTCEAQLWEALRASSAAPTFFSEIRVNGELHADGAIVANNPTAVALHEAKCMYPGVPIEVVVSIGNGLSAADVAAANAASHDRPPGAADGEEKMKAVGWGDVVGSIVASATSTEHVHHALSDLFPESKYFRFNPATLSNEIDETRPEKLADFVRDARNHIEANRERFAEVARTLRPKTTKSMWLRFRDAVAEEVTALAAIEDDVYLL